MEKPVRQVSDLSLKFGTFNTRFLPWSLTGRSRAEELSRRVLDGAYDVIGLSEVFDNRVRRRLVANLASQLPHYISYLGGPSRFRANSGLMLFSRHPFAQIPYPLRVSGTVVASNDGGRNPWCEVAFAPFRHSRSTDRMAGKGVALARIVANGSPINVGVLHMQASYASDSRREAERKVKTRVRQLHQVRDVIRQALGEDKARDEEVVILGDFNIDGSRSRHEDAKHEWHNIFRVLKPGFSGAPLHDLWHDFGPADEPGHTYPVSALASRMDYVLWSPRISESSLRVEKVEVASNLVTATGAHLSDHLGVNAYFEAATAREGSPKEKRSISGFSVRP